MNAEIINTGSELLNGKRSNLHALWLGGQLSMAGYSVVRQTAVPDTADAIEAALREALGRSQVILTTGGLGPTADDLTRQRIAALFDRPLREHAPTLDRLIKFFRMRGRPLPTTCRVQALVPRGARVLINEHGTAPGLVFHLKRHPLLPQGKEAFVILLPGPPRELQPMFLRRALPLLLRIRPPEEPRTTVQLRTTGLGESSVEECLQPVIQHYSAIGLETAFCVHLGGTDVRLSLPCRLPKVHLNKALREARKLLRGSIYTEGDEDLSTVVVHTLLRKKLTLATAESCTGGQLTSLVTNVPGASGTLLGGWVTYSNAAKHRELGVPEKLLNSKGAVSREVAMAMARGARDRAAADYALAITGIAGPGGGTAAKPVGTVYIALAGPTGAQCRRMFNPWDRETFKTVTAHQAMEVLRQSLKDD